MLHKHYLETTRDVYREAAVRPAPGLCCTTTPVWRLPGLEVPSRMLEMNYGCGSTVHPRDLAHDPTILYVGVGGGMELLQFAYFSRRPGGVIGIDVVDEMIARCWENLDEAQRLNAWFRADFVDVRKGDALALPVVDSSIDIAAQNCLFNIFEVDDLKVALEEMYRVLKPHGRLMLSDPVSQSPMPDSLRRDPQLRALCLSGALPLARYLQLIAGAGFGTIEVRAKRPYRVLDPKHCDTAELMVLDSVEVCAIKDPVPADGPCVFTGKAAIYYGDEAYFDDGNGHVLTPNQPLSVCDKTAAALKKSGRADIYVSSSTWFYDGGGCC
ncbi:methyltransferase domain-containing protein [bacterium]|nr:MAG: methyltransferase domain-containing protein [bacterium]